jgi:hypothetical protein
VVEGRYGGEGAAHSAARGLHDRTLCSCSEASMLAGHIHHAGIFEKVGISVLHAATEEMCVYTALRFFSLLTLNMPMKPSRQLMRRRHSMMMTGVTAKKKNWMPKKSHKSFCKSVR